MRTSSVVSCCGNWICISTPYISAAMATNTAMRRYSGRTGTVPRPIQAARAVISP